jgi:plastocyanin
VIRSISRSFAIVAGVLVLTVAGAGLLASASPVAAASQHQLQISGFAFQPSSVTVEVGDSVVWTNMDDAPHTVTAESAAFDSGNIDEGASYAFTLVEPGTYTYRCDYHSEMRATIVVEAAIGTSTDGASNTPPTNADATNGTAGPGEQPDTAMPGSSSTPNFALFLWGLGLLVMGISLLPTRRPRSVVIRHSGGGWRR